MGRIGSTCTQALSTLDSSLQPAPRRFQHGLHRFTLHRLTLVWSAAADATSSRRSSSGVAAAASAAASLPRSRFPGV